MLLTEIPLWMNCCEMFKTNITLHITFKYEFGSGTIYMLLIGSAMKPTQ